MADYGYPCYPYGSRRYSKNNLNAPDRNTNLNDALDSLNDVCYVKDWSRTCLEESVIYDCCLITGVASGLRLDLQINFQFICHHQRRDENLVRSIQCLHAKRLMVMLFFHIAERCRGVGTLDDMMTQTGYQAVLGAGAHPSAVLCSKVCYLHLYSRYYRRPLWCNDCRFCTELPTLSPGLVWPSPGICWTQFKHLRSGHKLWHGA